MSLDAPQTDQTNCLHRTDNNGNVTNVFTMDELLDSVMIYWATDSITSSIRLYKEFLDQTLFAGKDILDSRVEQPTAVAIFKDVCNAPEAWTKRRVNVQRWTVMPRGGHFAALEQPQLLAQDVANFIVQLADVSNQRNSDEL